ncbi:Zinc finger CCHC domain-containing protein 3 [Carex littledalei]|uniref:Zinc finger CCHC domain-containing protein 3 n=1 Tax=Carex littledalei TaxID=544730 RepID=A0A833QUK0_9POAL|nr:Zinc finger CCHC domain-containing protein 3 [Carex littledalei]
MAELHRLSSPNSPWCFRCGTKGHLTPACRNAVVCFACNRLGHRSSQCTAIRPELAPAHPPKTFAPHSAVSFPPLTATPTSHQQQPLLPTPPQSPLPTTHTSLPSYTPSFEQFQSAHTDRVEMPTGTALRPAIHTFHATAASENLEAAFKMSFLLTDVERWGPERITAALYRMSDPQSRHQWIVRVFDDFRYLILASSQFWLDSVLPKRTLRLENRDIPI